MLLRENLREHPAAQAWLATGPNRVAPKMIAVFKGWNQSEKSGVYRLAGVGPGGSAVIAKRCPLHTAAVERSIYEEFLPYLPLPSVGYYGSVEEPDGRSQWLFLEEAEGDLYSPQNNEHRAVAARWLAAAHNTSRRLGREMRLPDRGPKQYLQLMRSLRAKMLEHFTNPDLPSGGVAVLQTVVEQCDVLEGHWSEIEQICDGMPRTLVHGDFVVRNLRLRPSADGPVLLVFDWEFAGWGVPSTDLAQHSGYTASPDLAVYRVCLADWPMLSNKAQVESLAACGRFFRLLDELAWASIGLMYGRPDNLVNPIGNCSACGQRMAQALSEAGWITHS